MLYVEQLCESRLLAAIPLRETLKKLQDETWGFNDLDTIEERGLWPRFTTAGVAPALMKDRKRFQREQYSLRLLKQAGQLSSSFKGVENSINNEDNIL
jgi:hypothetical protein